MAGNVYQVGQVVRLSAAFTNAAGVAVDPTTVDFKVSDAAGNQSTYSAPVKDGVGLYHQDITITRTFGTWSWRAEGAGTAVAANETTFAVAVSAF